MTDKEMGNFFVCRYQENGFLDLSFYLVCYCLNPFTFSPKGYSETLFSACNNAGKEIIQAVSKRTSCYIYTLKFNFRIERKKDLPSAFKLLVSLGLVTHVHQEHV